MARQSPIRWYNPKQDAYEWREVPRTDEEALKLLEGAPYAPKCAETYQEWRNLGASVTAAFIRAGEAARDEREDQNEEAAE
jgi:hypothetical protein